MNMLDIDPLLNAYEKAKPAFGKPCVSTSITVDDEEMIVALVHPEIWKKMHDAFQWDPRSVEIPRANQDVHLPSQDNAPEALGRNIA
jgi:hypothetical protein